jgi:TonB-dependent starch-binding outer membrane protein SusC
MKQLLLSLSLLLLSNSLLWAQSRTITGTVLDEAGDPLIRATVLVKNTTTGAFTDGEGKFELQVPGPEAVLVFRYIGYEAKEVVVGDQAVVDVKMTSANATTDEVVVVGYTAQKRSKITGAVSSISADEIAETPVLRVEQALQGRAAGIQVTQNSGSPGSGLSVRIRGLGTINDSEPLYVVDGVLVEGLDFLNPNDIESINVLKDAASSAIYGTNGANGVVIITTKKGSRNQKAQISYDGYYGVQEPWKKLNLLTAEEYGIYINDARVNAGLAPFPELLDQSSLGEGTDWQDQVLTRAPIMSHQVSATGGSQTANYAISGNYFTQDGVVGGDKSGFERLTLRLNSDYDLSDRLKAGTRVNFVQIGRNFLPENNEFSTPLVRALNLDPVSEVVDEQGNYLPSRFLDTDIFNPVNQIENTFDRFESDRIFGALYAELEIIPGLKAKSTMNVDLTNASQRSFRPQYFLSVNDNNQINSVTFQNFRWFNYQWDNTLTYETTLNEKHDLFFLAGSSAREELYEFQVASRDSLLFNGVRYAYLNNGSNRRIDQTSGGGIVESSLLSFFGRANYSYDGKYLITAIFRADGSSRFGPNNRFGYFPSVSMGWVLSEETFMASNNTINFLKLRASWGQNGNQNIPNFQYQSLISRFYEGNGANGTYSYIFGPAEGQFGGAAPSRRPNRDIFWETTEQYNLGVDLGLWNDQLYLSADAFLRYTRDMLIAPQALGHVGALNSFVNAGTMRNQGLELAVNYQGRINQDIKLNLGGNVSFIQNELTSLGGEGEEPILTGFLQQAGAFIARTDVGFPVGHYYGFETDGIFQSQEEVAAHAFQDELTAPGDLRFVDQNNDGIINDDDQVIIGNPTPDWNFGFTASVSGYGFDMSVFLQGVAGNELYRGFTRYDFEMVNQPVSRLERWTPDNPSTTEPRAVWGDPNQNARVSDYFVEDGSFLRIKNIQIGYSLPAQVLDKLRMSKLRIYAAVQHLFTFTSYSGLDPEIGSRGTLEIGIDRSFYPAPRIWQGGIQIGL